MKHTNLLTQEDIKKFDQIDRDCIAMHVCPPPKTFIELSVTDGDGVEVERYTDRAHSWVRNAYNTFCSFMMGLYSSTGGGTFGAGKLANKSTSNAGVSFDTLHNIGGGYFEAATTGDFGILVGTGTTAESFEHYALVTPILSGATSGKLAYAAQSTAAGTYTSDTKKWSALHTRVFNNNSGASIVVGEVGLVVSAANGTKTMLCRDLLASAVTVPNAGQLTVTYTIEMTFPA